MFTFNKYLVHKLLIKYADHVMSGDSILSEISRGETIHQGPYLISRNDKEIELENVLIEAEVVLNIDDIKFYNLEKFTEDMFSIIEQQIKQLHKMIENQLTKITTFTGQVVKKNEYPNNYESCLEMLRKLPISFDEDNNPILPSIMVSDKRKGSYMINLKTLNDVFNVFRVISDEEKQRLIDLIDEKLKKYNAEKRIRRLSYLY